MKKFICLFLALLMTLTVFASCGKKNGENDPDATEVMADDEETTEEDGEEISYVLIADGSKQEGKTTAKTVGECLEEAGIELGEDDRVSPKKSKEMKDGMEITVKRVTKKQITETAYIPYDTEAKYSDKLKSGKSEVTRDGENGTKQITYEITYVDGKEESREIVSEEIVKAAVSQIVTYGTKKAEKTTEEKTTEPKTTKKTEEKTTAKTEEKTTKKPEPVTEPAEETTKKKSEPKTESAEITTKKESEPKSEKATEKTVVDVQDVYDCDGSGHGYKIITYSDDSTEYQDF